jgi:hypothetical protein
MNILSFFVLEEIGVRENSRRVLHPADPNRKNPLTNRNFMLNYETGKVPLPHSRPNPATIREIPGCNPCKMNHLQTT